MQISDVHLFLTIVETGSLSGAARRLDVSPMAVSRGLAALENELGVRLFQRTTRAVSATAEGFAFIPYARAMVEAENAAKANFSRQGKCVSGQLKITAPSGFGRRNLIPILPALLEQHPDLRIDLQLTEEIVDIVGQGIDVAIRIAPLRDSSLIARKIADNPRVVCASPAYLARHGCPSTLAELSEHSCLRLSNVPQWTFEMHGGLTRMSVDGRFSSSNVEGVREMCKAGLGLAQLTLWDIQQECREGALQEVTFTESSPQNLPIWALLPTSQKVPARVLIFIDALKTALS